jgi:hypothetical protein
MQQPRELPVIYSVTLRVFRRVVRGYFRRHFRAASAQCAERLAKADGPVIVYANHSSWWDPMVSVLLAECLLPGRKHYAPMDAEALKKYPILRRLGIFPVEMSSARGAAQFLRTSQAILAAGGVLWITPQGRFEDAREELRFKPGLGALAFWDERLPETLLRVGEPVRVAAGASSEMATEQMEQALAVVMRELKSAAMARDPKAFTSLLSGGRGTGGLYGVVRKLRGWITRKSLGLDHTERGDQK